MVSKGLDTELLFALAGDIPEKNSLRLQGMRFSLLAFGFCFGLGSLLAQQPAFTVFFDLGEAKGSMETFPSDFLPGNYTGMLLVTGYTDPVGSVSNNLALGLRRANFLKKKLVELGWPEEKIQVESKGEYHDYANLPHAEQRRAQVAWTALGQPPRSGCRAHFSGAILANHSVPGHISKIYDPRDPAGELVGDGAYPDNTKAFPKAVASTFDAIAVDPGTTVILYPEPDFKGKPLVELSGPAVLVNSIWFGDYRLREQGLRPDSSLDVLFPAEVRRFSEGNMHDWSYGSVRVMCKP